MKPTMTTMTELPWPTKKIRSAGKHSRRNTREAKRIIATGDLDVVEMGTFRIGPHQKWGHYTSHCKSISRFLLF